MAKIYLSDEVMDVIEVVGAVTTSVMMVRVFSSPTLKRSFVNVAERAFNLKFVKTK